MRYTSILVTGVFCCLVASCATSVDRVRNAAESVPDWYDDARTEIRGEGYPELASVPRLEKSETRPSRSIRVSQRESNKIIKLFDNNPRAQGPDKTLVDIEAIMREIQAEFEGQVPSPTHLTPREVSDIHAMFDIPYLTEGWFFTDAKR